MRTSAEAGWVVVVAVLTSLGCGGGGGGRTPDDDATLASLASSAGTLAPAFNAAITRYQLTVPAATAAVTLAPTASDPRAHSITIVQDGGGPVVVASGAASSPLAVPQEGITSSVTVTVVAEDGQTQRSYTLSVSRASTLCGTAVAAAPAIDPDLPAEPAIPGACAVLNAATATDAAGYPVSDPAAAPPDTARIQAAIDACAASLSAGTKGSVKLQRSPADSSLVAFVSGPLGLKSGVTLWIDTGATLFASRNPRDYDPAPGTPTCAVASGTSSGCRPFIAAASTANAGVAGQGTIDGQGGEPMVGGVPGDANASWWDFATGQSDLGRSFSNPRLIDVTKSQGFTLHQITLHDSPKFHVGLESDPFMVWGVTILTPSRKTNSVGAALTPHGATNTDGIDPYDAGNGFIVYSTISTGDDQIALKCGKYHLNSAANAGLPSCHDITIAHDHLGTGHGVSIGSETNAGVSDGTGVGVDGLHVYDLSIDGLLPSGNAGNVNLNGIRIKSDQSRGGIVRNVTYEDVCLRGLANPILLNPDYDSSATGNAIPTFQGVTLRNVRHVACPGATAAPVVTLRGHDASHRSEVALDGVVVDGIAAANVQAGHASAVLGPGLVNFTPAGAGVTVTDQRTGAGAPNACAGKFVALPAAR